MSKIIYLNFNCNQRCVFCLGRHRNSLRHNEKILSQIERGERLVISGGETTLSPDLFKILKSAMDKGIKNIELQTNGITLADIVLAKNLIKAGVKEFNVNMPSHLEDLSDKITQITGSFKKKIKGLKNLINLKAYVRLTFVIHTLNYRTMENYLRFIRDKLGPVKIVEMNFIQIEGATKDSLELVPSFRQIRAFFQKACQFALREKIFLLTDNIPLCIFGKKKYFRFSVDYRKKYLQEKNKVIDETLNRAKKFIPKCQNCFYYKEFCKGIRIDYLKLYGDKGLTPIVN